MGRAPSGRHDGRRAGGPEGQYGCGPAAARRRFDRLEEVALAYAFAIKAVEGF